MVAMDVFIPLRNALDIENVPEARVLGTAIDGDFLTAGFGTGVDWGVLAGVLEIPKLNIGVAFFLTGVGVGASTGAGSTVLGFGVEKKEKDCFFSFTTGAGGGVSVTTSSFFGCDTKNENAAFLGWSLLASGTDSSIGSAFFFAGFENKEKLDLDGVGSDSAGVGALDTTAGFAFFTFCFGAPNNVPNTSDTVFDDVTFAVEATGGGVVSFFETIGLASFLIVVDLLSLLNRVERKSGFASCFLVSSLLVSGTLFAGADFPILKRGVALVIFSTSSMLSDATGLDVGLGEKKENTSLLCSLGGTLGSAAGIGSGFLSSFVPKNEKEACDLGGVSVDFTSAVGSLAGVCVFFLGEKKENVELVLGINVLVDDEVISFLLGITLGAISFFGINFALGDSFALDFKPNSELNASVTASPTSVSTLGEGFAGGLGVMGLGG